LDIPAHDGLSEGFDPAGIFKSVVALTGIIGTAMGVIVGCLFALNVDRYLDGELAVQGQRLDLSIRDLLPAPPSWSLASDVGGALSLGLSFILTIFPARLPADEPRRGAAL